MTKRTCSIEGCGRKHKARGLCQAHALRLKKYGSVDAQRPIRPQSRPADERFWEKVEKTDACWLWTGCLTDGYGHFSIGVERILAHRLSYEWAVGPIPEGLALDHICHVRRCVRPAHLRLATWKQNAENPSGLRSDNTSGARGVYWSAPLQKWTVFVGHFGRQYYGGSFDTFAEAEAAAIAKRNDLFTHNVKDRSA